MSNDGATLVLTIIGSVILWTGSIVSLMVWLQSKFDDLKRSFYSEVNKIRAEISNLERQVDDTFREHSNRLYRLEYRTFGFGGSPVGPQTHEGQLTYRDERQ